VLTFVPLQCLAGTTLVPLKPRSDLDTFYVSIGVAEDQAEDYLVDTGAGYMTITSETLKRLQQAGDATRVGELDGRMANGSVVRVPVYRLSEITVGQSCVLRNVEAAVLPGASRGLFGLSALRKASPFQFSVDPPFLTLSNCLENLDNAVAAD
jgi:predicted aspartyl protease